MVSFGVNISPLGKEGVMIDRAIGLLVLGALTLGTLVGGLVAFVWAGEILARAIGEYPSVLQALGFTSAVLFNLAGVLEISRRFAVLFFRYLDGTPEEVEASDAS